MNTQASDPDTTLGEPLRTAGAMEPGEFTATLNGLELWYKVAGKGPVCLLPTPGWGCSIHYLKDLEPLEELFTMVYLETRGTGRSEPPPTTSEFTWDHFTMDLDALRQHLQQERLWLLGHSQGGMIVMHYALTHPERVQGMIVIDSAAGFDTEMLRDAIARADLHEYGAVLERLFDSQLAHPPMTEAELHTLLATDQPIFYWHDVSNADIHASTFAKVSVALHAWQGCAYSHQASYDFISHLAGIQAPTLIVVGVSDVVCSLTQAERLHRGIANSKLLVIEKAGHFPWLEAPEAFFGGVRAFLPAVGYAPQ